MHRICTICKISVFLTAVIFFAGDSLSLAQTGSGTSHLSRGIYLYKAQRYDEALTEFNAEVSVNENCSLAYYYAAKIRVARKQYDRAKRNLQAAVRDSSNFSAAYGMLAYTGKLSGDRPSAMENWNKYLSLLGVEKNNVSFETIVTPEIFEKNLPVTPKTGIAAKASPPVSTASGQPETVKTAPVAAKTVSQTPVPSQPSKTVEQIKAGDVKNENAVVAKLEEERLARERQRKAKAALADTEARANNKVNSQSEAYNKPFPAVPPSSKNPGTRKLSGLGDSAIAENGAGMSAFSAELRDMDERIKSEINKGFMGLGLSAAFVVLGTGFIIWRMRKRKKTREEFLFADTIARVVKEREPEDELLERIDELAATENMNPDIIPPREERSEPVTRMLSSRVEPAEAFSALAEKPGTGRYNKEFMLRPTPEEKEFRGKLFEDDNNAPTDYGAVSGQSKRPITEEIKALVTRLHRDGYSVEDIARVSDLTKTEVELIVAVRSKKLTQMIAEIAEEEADDERDNFSRVVRELEREGLTHREIARKLGISVSEVNFMLAVIHAKGA